MVRLRPYALRNKRVYKPGIQTKREQTQPIDYKGGWFDGAPNDLQPKGTLRYITDARFDGIGKYKTRQGCDHYSLAVGQSLTASQGSTVGAADQEISASTWIAHKLTISAPGPIVRADVNLKNLAGAGTVVICVYSDNSGTPGSMLARSTVDVTDITSTYGYKTVYFMAAPEGVSATAVWVVVYLQESASGVMYVSSTTSSSNGRLSTDGGQTWTTPSVGYNVRLFTGTTGGVKGMTRVTRPDGTAATFFAHGSDIYKVNDSDGTLTSVDSGISSSSTHVRFEYVNDTLYYTDGVNKPRKYDWSSASEVTTAPAGARNIIEHVGLLWFMDLTNNGGYYSAFNDFENFDMTTIYGGGQFNVPSPNTSDPLTAFAKLNGVLYKFTKRNKYQTLGTDTATFSSREAYAQKGTYSQESVVYDENNIYFASDDGIYKFNGTYEKNIAEPIINSYTSLLNKESIHVQLFNNRLYVWYVPNGGSDVTECFVYNTLYDVWESKDLNTYIGRSFARHDTTGNFYQASNRAGVIYYGELPTNDYDNLGDILQAEVRTNYDHFGSPQQLKRLPYWRPIIEEVSGNYSVQMGFATDYNEAATFTNVSAQAGGYRYDESGTIYGIATYASSVASRTDTTMVTSSSAYRWQRRYKHHAAREPFEFSGEVLQVETRRLR